MHFLVLFHTFMRKLKTFSNFEWCSGWNNGVMGSWTTWFLGAWNKRGAAKFRPFLINVVAEIRDLWVENFQKINCRDVTSIWKGRVGLECKRHFFSSKLCKYWKLLCCDKWHPGTVRNTDTIKNRHLRTWDGFKTTTIVVWWWRGIHSSVLKWVIILIHSYQKCSTLKVHFNWCSSG